jgi:hypothetical protein
LILTARVISGVAKLQSPHGSIAEKTNPGALELKKSRPSLGNYKFCKALTSPKATAPYYIHLNYSAHLGIITRHTQLTQ